MQLQTFPKTRNLLCIFIAQNGKAQIYVFPWSKMAPQLSLANFLHMLWFRKPNCDPEKEKTNTKIDDSTAIQKAQYLLG